MTYELYKYQSDAVEELKHKYIVRSNVGSGKTAMMMRWLKWKCENTNKSKVLIVTTPSKRDSINPNGLSDFQNEAMIWNGEEWEQSLEEFTIISWHGLSKWVSEHKLNLRDFVYGFDEVARASSGFGSGMGKAFLKITYQTSDWAGFTGTPGDAWIKYYPYFVATKKITNKTEFMRRFVRTQTYKGFPEIIGYNDQNILKQWWDDITVSVDTSEMERQMPKETNQVIHFKQPTGYKKVIKERKRLDDNEMITSTMGMCMYLRQLCFTKEKQQWIADFLESLNTNCVFFCNFIEEEETLCEIAQKTLPKGAKIWRIDGSHHDIPTKDTIGERDIVVAHYQSGGEALNLQFINYWLTVSPNYSYSQSVQAKGRIRRVGQTKPMFFYFLETDNTIENDIYKCLSGKKDFAEKVWALQNIDQDDNL